MRLLAVFQISVTTSVTKGNHGKNDDGAQEHSRGGVQEELPRVEEALGKVRALARRVF